MSVYASNHPDAPSRQLASSLLDEALAELAAARHPAPPALGPLPPQRAGPQTGRPRRWTDEAIAAALTAFQVRQGRRPLRREWRDAGRHHLPGRATTVRVYGSLEAACVACRDGERHG